MVFSQWFWSKLYYIQDKDIARYACRSRTLIRKSVRMLSVTCTIILPAFVGSPDSRSCLWSKHNNRGWSSLHWCNGKFTSENEHVGNFRKKSGFALQYVAHLLVWAEQWKALCGVVCYGTAPWRRDSVMNTPTIGRTSKSWEKARVRNPMRATTLGADNAQLSVMNDRRNRCSHQVV